MKCKVCGAESGKYVLCRDCYAKKEQGLIIKCPRCNNWHYKDASCPMVIQSEEDSFLYEPRKALMTHSELLFWDALKKTIPDGYYVFPQINLASFIEKTDDSRFRNELFRNVDFLITDGEYSPKIVVEINDQSHLDRNRRERDEKVQNILEEAGIPIVKLWTSYGVNMDYIRKKVDEALNSPIERKHHFIQSETVQEPGPEENGKEEKQPEAPQTAKPVKKEGCYIATCVYGSYDCPQVWAFRRYRDSILKNSLLGRAFIRLYYAVSPHAVRLFGNNALFLAGTRRILDKKLVKLKERGCTDRPYRDPQT